MIFISRYQASVLAVIASLSLAGCKPSASPGGSRALSSPDEHAPSLGDGVSRQPNSDDLASFLRSLIPPIARLVNVKMDPPVRMPNTSPDSNAWVLNVKMTIAPTEDLLSLPSEQDTKEFKAVEGELDGIIRWRNAFVQSPYARFYPSFEVKAPTSPVPQLLVLTHRADQPLPPIYGRMYAEWQMDHWNFSKDEFNMPDPGQPRSSFTGSYVIKGSHEAEAFLAAEREAIAQAKPKQAAIDSSYAADLVKATRQGTIYRGQVSSGNTAVPAEVRFVEPPTSDEQFAQFEVRLPSAPGNLYVYTAKLAKRMPIHPAPAPGDNDLAQTPDDLASTPKSDLTVGLLHVSGKEIVASTVPNQLLMALTHYDPPHTLSITVLNRRMDGKLANPLGPFMLSAQQTP